MLRGFLRPLLCSLVFVGQIYAQEVVVPSEAKQEAPTQATPSSESEQILSESATPAPTKTKSRAKKSAAPTLEQMRAAGALAAEGRDERSVAQPTRTGESHAETTATPKPAVSPTATPVEREAHTQQKSTPRPSSPRGTNLESIGPVRPTMIESGREQPSATPSGR